MKLLLLIFALLLLVQQYVLYNERQRLCTLIAVIEHREDSGDDVPSPKLIEPCVLPKHIDSPRWDLGHLKPQEN